MQFATDVTAKNNINSMIWTPAIALRTRGSWVQILPGAPIFKHLANLRDWLFASARLLRDFLRTNHLFATRKSVMLGVPLAAQIRFVAAISSPISAAE